MVDREGTFSEGEHAGNVLRSLEEWLDSAVNTVAFNGATAESSDEYDDGAFWAFTEVRRKLAQLRRES